MTRLFTADYSTGNFDQWALMDNVVTQNGGPSLYQGSLGGYPAQIVALGDGGYCGRFEVRAGDVPATQPTGERSQVGEGHATELTPAESTRWYAFSVKFDTTFPTNHGSLGWAVTNQFKSGVDGNPTLSLQFLGFTPDDHVSLVHVPQSEPLVQLGLHRILDFPLDRGNWHDFKFRIVWSPLDANGSVQVWYDGVRQTFRAEVGGGQTYTGRTMIPDTDFVAYSEGLYRESGIGPTGIIFHKDFRIADSEADL